ncbi:MAG TPA: hypothetical protein VKS78_08120 [Roseiarcus sp.]|nr:hypothetical protein [Roseiarcus sp.]
MGQIIGLICAGALFLSFFAYYEARDALGATAFHLSPGVAKMGGLLAACLTIAVGVVVCCALLAGEPPYEVAF